MLIDTRSLPKQECQFASLAQSFLYLVLIKKKLGHLLLGISYYHVCFLNVGLGFLSYCIAIIDEKNSFK